MSLKILQELREQIVKHSGYTYSFPTLPDKINYETSFPFFKRSKCRRCHYRFISIVIGEKKWNYLLSETIPPRDAAILEARWGLGGYPEGVDLNKIGRAFHITMSRVRDIEVKHHHWKTLDKLILLIELGFKPDIWQTRICDVNAPDENNFWTLFPKQLMFILKEYNNYMTFQDLKDIDIETLGNIKGIGEVKVKLLKDMITVLDHKSFKE